MSPFWFVLLALLGYGAAYFGYARWYDRAVWRPDAGRTTPAHMYMDGVEYFPVSRYVLWGYQYKSVAALGPILGPYIALQYGWLPALIWIIVGNFFIGWIQDYGSIMVSVRSQGRSFGPISHETMGAGGRNTLLGFVLFYLLIFSAAFIHLVAVFWNEFPATFWATMGVLAAGAITGQLLYRARVSIVVTTGVALVLVALSVVLGVHAPTPADVFGPWTLPFWAAVCCAVLYVASILPLPSFIQPVNYVSFFPAFLAVLAILIGALLSPALGVTLREPAWKAWTTPAAGPIWPMMFVAIACGAISGWHSLVGSSSTSRQLDVETDARPVGAGAMLSEGLLALASLAAFMVLSPREAGGTGNVGAWVDGAVRLTKGYLGGPAAAAALKAYFALTLVIFALTVQALVTRFWRLVSAEVFQGRAAWLGRRHVATLVGLGVPWLFAVTGGWTNLWLYFGGANQLLAGLALMLITIHLVRAGSRTAPTLWPAAFMIVTTLASLLIQAWFFARAILRGRPLVGAGSPLGAPPWHLAAIAVNGAFVAVGLALFALGLRMAVLACRAYVAGRRAAGAAPAAADD